MSVDDLEAELSALAVPGQESSLPSPRESGGTVAIPGRSVAVAPGQKLLLAGGIALALVLAALPLAFLVWMLMLIAGTAATAGGLAATRGLAETTYGAGFVMAAVGLVACVVGPLLLRFARRERPPSLWRRLLSSPFIVPLGFFLVALPSPCAAGHGRHGRARLADDGRAARLLGIRRLPAAPSVAARDPRRCARPVPVGGRRAVSRRHRRGWDSAAGCRYSHVPERGWGTKARPTLKLPWIAWPSFPTPTTSSTTATCSSQASRVRRRARCVLKRRRRDPDGLRRVRGLR
jgi:hypothetical protein